MGCCPEEAVSGREKSEEGRIPGRGAPRHLPLSEKDYSAQGLQKGILVASSLRRQGRPLKVEIPRGFWKKRSKYGRGEASFG